MEFVILFLGLFAFWFGIFGMSTESDKMEDAIKEHIEKRKARKE